MKRILMTLLSTALASAPAILSAAEPGRPEAPAGRQPEVRLLNASYDPTRELYAQLDRRFEDEYRGRSGRDLVIDQSHGGSGAQARAVIGGLKADVVTLALEPDVSAIEKAGLIREGWRDRLPDHASPYTSTVVFLVRKGNPKGIKDWPDLTRDGVQVVAPDPRTSGGARWAFLAAWGYAAGVRGQDAAAFQGDEREAPAAGQANPAPSAPPSPEAAAVLDSPKARDWVTRLYQHVISLDPGARGATLSFAERNQGDVLLTWENEAWLARQEFGGDRFEIVYPSLSVLAEPPVAVVDRNVDERGTREAAEAFLRFLYTPEAQQIIAANHYRPRNREAAARYRQELPAVSLFTVDGAFGGWAAVQQRLFAEGGEADRILRQHNGAAAAPEAAHVAK